MRNKDNLTAAYLRSNSRFADLINVHCFGGRTVIQPEDVREDDSVEIRIQREGRKITSRKRYRDVVRRVACGMKFTVICVEGQSYVDYTMPVRVMGYDTGRYEQQILIRKQKHAQRRDLKGDECLSGIAKGERLQPVITIVLYFGKHWDGARSLKELLDLDGFPPEICEMTADYPISVIEVGNYPWAEDFTTDLKLVFGFIQNADDKEKLQAFAQREKQGFAELAEDAYDLIGAMTNTKELDRIKKENQMGRERINMCKAIDDMLADAREEGRKEAMNGLQEMIADAKEKGRSEAEKTMIRVFVHSYLEEGCSQEEIDQKLQKLFPDRKINLAEYFA